MDLNQLRSFVAVAKQGHLTRAAETLHLSQPALSGQIKALEEDLGVSLFQRSSSGMALTPSGRRLLLHAEGVIDAVQQMSNAAQALRGEPTGKLIVGTVLDPKILRVGELLARITERNPQIEIELTQVVSHEGLAAIRNGTLDASFFFGAKPDKGLNAVVLREITYRVVVPAAWAELADAEWEYLAPRPWVVAPAGSSQRQLVLQLFHGHGGEPERTIESDNESVIANLVESGVGLSLVREELARAGQAAGRCVIWPGAKVRTHLWLAYAADREGDPLIAAVLAALNDVWAAAPAVAAPAAA
jgi:DNA-binding transcriptional LysR family regulator